MPVLVTRGRCTILIMLRLCNYGHLLFCVCSGYTLLKSWQSSPFHEIQNTSFVSNCYASQMQSTTIWGVWNLKSLRLHLEWNERCGWFGLLLTFQWLGTKAPTITTSSSSEPPLGPFLSILREYNILKTGSKLNMVKTVFLYTLSKVSYHFYWCFLSLGVLFLWEQFYWFVCLFFELNSHFTFLSFSNKPHFLPHPHQFICIRPHFLYHTDVLCVYKVALHLVNLLSGIIHSDWQSSHGSQAKVYHIACHLIILNWRCQGLIWDLLYARHGLYHWIAAHSCKKLSFPLPFGSFFHAHQHLLSNAWLNPPPRPTVALPQHWDSET